MTFIEYFSSDNRNYWLSQIEKSDWDAARFLCDLIKNNSFFKLVGENSRILMLTDGENLISFCTLAKMDDVQPTSLTPWIGWVYTFPQFRRKRMCEKLLSHAESVAKQDGAEYTYISTNHIGLYEKFGYEFLSEMTDINNESTRVYRKKV